MEEIINKLLIALTPTVCNGIEEKDWFEAKQEYHRILQNRYLEIDKKLNTEDYDELHNSLYNSEFEEWSSLSIPIKKSLLIKDNILEKITDISNKAFRHAEARLAHGTFINEEIADAYITKLELLLTQVHDHNRSQADWNIKEATIDLMYASNQSDNVSTRISHLI